MPETVEPVVEDPRWEAAGIPAVAERAARAALAAVGRDPDLHEVGLLALRRREDGRSSTASSAARRQPTNVLSWPAFPGEVPVPPGEPGEGPLFLGDIALGYETCAARGRGGGDPARRPRGASRGARGPAPPRPRPRGGRRGRGDGGDRDESACQHGYGEPIFRLGAPLGRDAGQETWARHPTGRRGRPRCPEDADPDSPARSFFSAHLPPRFPRRRRRRPARRADRARRGRAAAGQPPQPAPHARRRRQRAAGGHRRDRRRRDPRGGGRRSSRRARCRGCRSIPRRSTSRSGSSTSRIWR